MASRLYPKFLDLARKWPKEPKNAISLSAEKHLGKVLRAVIAKHYPQGSITKVADEHQLASIYESFNKLSNSVHLAKYPRQFQSSATGLKSEDLEGTTLADISAIIRRRADGNEGIRGSYQSFTHTFKGFFKGNKN